MESLPTISTTGGVGGIDSKFTNSLASTTHEDVGSDSSDVSYVLSKARSSALSSSVSVDAVTSEF